MPIRETRCLSCGFEAEHFYKRQADCPQACDQCGKETQFLISSFHAPWTGTLDRFVDRKSSMLNQTSDGHMAWRVKSSRAIDGSPERVHITTRQQQKEFIKDEGLSDPFEANVHAGPDADGKQSSSRPKGAWV